jgi:hypothetical protein
METPWRDLKVSAISGDSKTVGEAAVTGVFGSDPRIVDQRDFAAGVLGLAIGQPAVWGIASGGPGVLGLVQGDGSIGVQGRSDIDGDTGTSGTGVLGLGTTGVTGRGVVGVRGFGQGGNGFLGGTDPHFIQHAGVYGESDQQGVMGLSTSDLGTGVFGGNPTKGSHGFGVRGETFDGVGVHGKSLANGLAGEFIGNVSIEGVLNVSGDVLLPNRDISERFAVASLAECEPGMVMVVGGDGMLTACARAYDRRVIGVISGAGTLRPAVTLGHGQHAGPDVAIALVGTAYCLVDADHGEIGVGDLLTSAPTRGHAMKVVDPLQSPGAVIGKALAPLERGQGLIPIVISLQ